MTQTTLCRLCISSCCTFKSLLDDNGQINGVYKTAVKFFQSMLLNPRLEHIPKVICIECWQHIEDFHTFQQSVIKTQSKLEYLQPIIHIPRLDANANVNKISFNKNTKNGLEPIVRVTRLEDHTNVTQKAGTENMKNGLVPDYMATKETTQLSVFDIIHINCESSPERSSQKDDQKKVDVQNEETNIIVPTEFTDTAAFQLYPEIEIPNILATNTVQNEEMNINLPNEFTDAAAFQLYPPTEIPNIFATNENYTPYIYADNDINRTANTQLNMTFVKDNYIQSWSSSDVLLPYSKKQKKKENDDYIAKWKGDLECVICKEIFKNYSLLNEHFRNIHPLEKCHIVCCEHKLNEKCRIVAHIRKCHDKESFEIRYKCQICESSFSRDINLKNHIRRKHPASISDRKYSLSYRCENCRSKFSREERLIKHIRKMHPEKFVPQTNVMVLQSNTYNSIAPKLIDGTGTMEQNATLNGELMEINNNNDFGVMEKEKEIDKNLVDISLLIVEKSQGNNEKDTKINEIPSCFSITNDINDQISSNSNSFINTEINEFLQIESIVDIEIKKPIECHNNQKISEDENQFDTIHKPVLEAFQGNEELLTKTNVLTNSSFFTDAHQIPDELLASSSTSFNANNQFTDELLEPISRCSSVDSYDETSEFLMDESDNDETCKPSLDIIDVKMEMLSNSDSQSNTESIKLNSLQLDL